MAIDKELEIHKIICTISTNRDTNILLTRNVFANEFNKLSGKKKILVLSNTVNEEYTFLVGLHVHNTLKVIYLLLPMLLVF